VTPVLWLKAHPLCWDQDMIDRLLSGRLWRTRHCFEHHVDSLPPCDGAVVVAPARYFTPTEIQQVIDPLGWVLLILTSDEESTFPVAQLHHANMRVWVMTPRPGVHDGDFYIGEGWSPGTPEAIGPEMDRPYDWVFAGQVTHARRTECVSTLRDLPGGVLIETAGFAKGIPQADYLSLISAAKVAPCPSGPATPDSFRLYEALEAGCVPIVDDPCPGWQTPGYFDLTLGDVPFPVLTDWDDLPDALDLILDNWTSSALRCRSWWQGYKRRLARRLDGDLADLGVPSLEAAPDDLITVVIPTSPIPSHPSTQVIEETIASVRRLLPAADIVIGCDGVRPEQADRQDAYDEYLLRLTALCRDWRALTAVSAQHVHQANTTRAALAIVHTPLVMFVEHDTPLCGDIDLVGISCAVLSGEANVVRLHHEAHILEPHRHLMLDTEPQSIEGVPLLRTVQWSQRPHIAGTDFYRSLIDTYFGQGSRTMIEDVMHGVVDQAWRENGVEGWAQWRVWMYAPDGDMKRSLHLDGREHDSKFEDRFVFAYDGPTPEGAPRPTSER
jgi:hypothetical protein